MICHDDRRRLAYAFRRAARATITTSSTTGAAFLANAFNPMMPMSSFGIYAAILILVVYAIIVLFFPPLMIFQERYLSNCCKRCFKCCKKSSNTVQIFDQSDVTVEAKELGFLEKFFGGTLNNFVKRFKWFIILIATIWTCVAFWMAS